MSSLIGTATGIGVFSTRLLGVVGPILTDNVMSESHHDSAQVPDYALQNASIVGEHIILNPAEVSLQFELTNQDTKNTSYGLRAALLYNLLVFGMRGRELYTLVTRHRLYTNMAIIDIVADHVGPYGGGLTVGAQFKQVNLPSLTALDIVVDQLAQDGTQLTAASDLKSGNLILQTAETSANAFEIENTLFSQ